MHAVEQSDIGIVPKKEPNKMVCSHAMAEVPEGRPMTKGKFWRVVCDLYAETGVSIERT
jgi:hypothetical protein